MKKNLKARLQKEYILPSDEIGFFHKAGYAVEDVMSLPTEVLSAIVEAYLYVNCIKLMKDSRSHDFSYEADDRLQSKCYREAYYMLKSTDWNLIGASVEPILQEIETCDFNSIKSISDKKMWTIAGKDAFGILNKEERMTKLGKALYKIQYKKLQYKKLANGYFDLDLTMEKQFKAYFQYIAYAMEELQDNWESKQMIIAPLFSIEETGGKFFGILKHSIVTTIYVPKKEVYEVYNPMLKESQLCTIDKNGIYGTMLLNLKWLGDDLEELDGLGFDEDNISMYNCDFKKVFEQYEEAEIAELEGEEPEYEEDEFEDAMEYEENEVEYEEDEVEYEEDEFEDAMEYEEDEVEDEEEDEPEYEWQ